MLKFLRDMLAGKSTQQTEEQSTEIDRPPLKKTSERQIDPFQLGLRDSVLAGWFNNQTDCIVSDFHIGPDDIVLDAGCGDGGYSNFCGQRGAHIILVDIDSEKIKIAEERLKKTLARKVEAIVTDSNPLPIPSETITRIISAEVVEHVDDPVVFFSELARVGKPGARYLLTAPDPVAENLQQGIAPEEYFQAPNHIRIIERDEFEKLVTDAGLLIEERIPRSAYWTIWWLFFWHVGDELNPPWHPLLQHWAKTWETLINSEGGLEVKAKLDEVLPKSQVIIARKP
jgi:SAM-dependent methyltransferase